MQDEQIMQTRFSVNVYLAIDNVNHKKNWQSVKLQLFCVHINQLSKVWDYPIKRPMVISFFFLPRCLKYSKPMLDLHPCIYDAVPGIKKKIHICSIPKRTKVLF